MFKKILFSIVIIITTFNTQTFACEQEELVEENFNNILKHLYCPSSEILQLGGDTILKAPPECINRRIGNFRPSNDDIMRVSNFIRSACTMIHTATWGDRRFVQVEIPRHIDMFKLSEEFCNLWNYPLQGLFRYTKECFIELGNEKCKSISTIKILDGKGKFLEGIKPHLLPLMFHDYDQPFTQYSIDRIDINLMFWKLFDLDLKLLALLATALIELETISLMVCHLKQIIFELSGSGRGEEAAILQQIVDSPSDTSAALYKVQLFYKKKRDSASTDEDVI